MDRHVRVLRCALRAPTSAAIMSTSASMSTSSTSASASTSSAEGHGRARVGVLFRDRGVRAQVQTPCYVPPSVMGIAPHVTPDNYAKLRDLTTQVVDFADIFSELDTLKQHRITLRDFLHARGTNLLLSARDYINASNPPTTRAGYVIATGKGRRIVSPAELMDAAAMLEAELVVPLADEIAASFGQNRQRAAVQATLEWLDECLSNKRECHAELMICGVVVGGTHERLRRISAEETARRDVQAFLLSGVDACENAAQAQATIDAVVGTLEQVGPHAAALPRFVTGIGHPIAVLQAIARGVDAFVSPFPATMTQAHAAFNFWIDAAEDNARVRAMERDRSGSVLHLREKRFEKDFTPLVADCECYTCQQYTRAYIHHLLNVREMLGDTLLYVHNMHHYYRFFRTIRARIADGTFAAFQEMFVSKFDERASTAPPLPTPHSIAERQEKKDAELAERAEKKAALAAAAATKAKADAAAKRQEQPVH